VRIYDYNDHLVIVATLGTVSPSKSYATLVHLGVGELLCTLFVTPGMRVRRLMLAMCGVG
jgi:hypothetical protein